MARIIYSALVSQIAGTIGGTTFQRNAYGFTVKNKPNMVKPVRSRQVVRKINFQANVQRWRELSQSDRDLWIAYALTYPVASRLNPSSNLNGFNYFCRYQSYLSVYDFSSVLDDPGGAPVSIADVAIDVYIDGGALRVGITATVGGGSFQALVYMTRTQGVGQVFVQDTPVFIQAIAGAFPADEDVTAAYTLKFGAIPADSDAIGVKVVFLRLDAAQATVVPASRVVVDS